MGTHHKERKQKRSERREERQKARYPSRTFATIYWVILGITLPLVFIVPAASDIYQGYTDGLIYGSIVWGFFLVGSILYTIRYGLKGIRRCPNCQKQVYKGRKHCDSCGARVWWDCPKCHTRTKKHKEFCECGQSLRVITFARQIEFEGEIQHSESQPKSSTSSLVVTGSVVQFCPACGAEIQEDLTHCSICGSTLNR